MTKANQTTEEVSYCLGNGGTISYTYSPGSSVLTIIQNTVSQYVETGYSNADPPDFIWVQPRVFAKLNSELHRFASINQSWSFQNAVIRVSTIYRIVAILVDPELEIPIFYGTQEEKQDVLFNKLFEEHLNG